MPLREFDLDRDYDPVIALWRAAAPGVHVGPSDTRAELAKKVACAPDLFLVLEEAGQLIGSVIGGYDGRRGLIYHLAVLPERRGTGLGRVLMEAIEGRLKAKGCLKAYLLVAPENLDVIPFYEKLGWEEMPVKLLGKQMT
jgi:ribosomal protein S18 acetylase RimI-like enzyme